MVSSRAVRARVAAGGGDSAVVAVQSPAPRPARAGRKSSSRGEQRGTCGSEADRGGRRRGDVTSIMPLRLASAVSMSVLSRSKKTARTRLSPIASPLKPRASRLGRTEHARGRPGSRGAGSRGHLTLPKCQGLVSMCGREITRESDSIHFVEGARTRDGIEPIMASSLVCGWTV